MIRIFCRAADAILKETQTLTSGMTNYPEVVLTFSQDWDGFGKAVVVRAGTADPVSVLVTNNKFIIPAECLAQHGVNLSVGISGTNGVETIPTIWCAVGEIYEGADIDEASNIGEATLTLVEQMLGYAGDCETSADASADSAADSASSAADAAASAASSAESAEEAAASAAAAYQDAEVWAKGTRGGVPVEEGEDGYHDNAKYYSEQSSSSATTAASSAASAMGYASSASSSKTAAQTAQGAAETAQGKAETAASNAVSYETLAYQYSLSADSSASSAASSASSAGTSATAAANSATSAAGSASSAESSKGDAAGSATAAAQSATSAGSSASAAETYATNAGNSASSASSSASAASADALEAEGYAVGKQNGTDVGSSSPYYHNNAKYYKEQAAASATSAESAKTAAQAAQAAAETAAATFETDTTLAVSGKAADAKVTGDNFTQLSTAITENTQNLFSANKIYNRNGLAINDGVVTNTATDTRNNLQFLVSIYNDESSQRIAVSDAKNVNSNGRVFLTVTPPSNGTKVEIRHNGSSKDLSLYFRCDTTANLPYTFSCYVNGYNPKVVGGISFDKIQFEQNDKATEYVTPLTAVDQIARIDEENDYARLESNFENFNLLDIRNVSNQKIAYATGQIAADNNVRLTDYIPVKENTKYIIMPEYASGTYGLAFFDQQKAFVSGVSQSYSGASKLAPFVFVTPSGVSYIRFNIWHTQLNKACCYEYSDSIAKRLYNGLEIDGDEIKVNPVIKIARESNYGNASAYENILQGGAIYNGKLFGFSDDLQRRVVIDLADYSVTNITYNGSAVYNHANNVSFGTSFYDSGDTYPVIYISSEDQKYCGIFRITVSDGAYAIEEISRITYPSIVSIYANLTVDRENEKMYIRTSITGEDGIFLIEYDLPEQINTNITLEYVEKSEEHPYGYTKLIPYVAQRVDTGASGDGFAQDSFIHGKKYYSVGGSSNSARLNVFDLESETEVSFVNLTSYISTEPEICSRYDNKIIITDTSGNIFSVVT